MLRAYTGTACAFGLALLIGATAPAFAQPAVQQGTYKPAERGECQREYPLYPAKERERWTEGWVDLRFTVTVDGAVKDVIIANQMGRGDFGPHTVKWLLECKYSPAQRNGKPVQALNVFQRVFFMIDKTSQGASPELGRRLRAVDDLLEQGQAEKAMTSLADISKDSTYLYEMVNILARRAQAMALMNKPDIALLYLRQLRSSENDLPLREQAWLRRLALRLALAQGLYLEAKEIAARTKGLGERDGDERLMKSLATLTDLVASPTAISVTGRVPAECEPEICSPEKPVWSYRPVRRTLSLDNIQGELDSVEAQCDARTFQAKAVAGVTWTIPASWGVCTIVVSGKPGSTFTLIDENI
ncbi:energy transducer TonB [Niveispirillum sp.]|uniref:energy transducer TonB n=1 Tax=Niveispirillum sp. TaxID=1917217 RepID=UPI001B5617CA|nr:energy transducer TonB [Niveispirillum sp.]MBP7336083.1 energy transducer TonB [Niveispirillum sp.]